MPPVSAPANSDQSPIHPGLRAHTKPSITVITIIYSQVTKRDDVRNCVDFIGSHLPDDFYLEKDTQKLVVVDNLCTGPFENITHILDARFHRQPQLPGSGTRRRGSRYHAGSFDRTRKWRRPSHGDSRDRAGRHDRATIGCSIRSPPAARHRARHWQKHLKVGTFNN